MTQIKNNCCDITRALLWKYAFLKLNVFMSLKAEINYFDYILLNLTNKTIIKLIRQYRERYMKGKGLNT